MHLALLGFGLVGGSIARALRERQPRVWKIAAWSPRGLGPARAVADGTIDVAARSPEEVVRDADLVVLAAPPLACLELLDRIAERPAPPGAVVTDVASTKRAIIARAAALGLPFVGGHPMAGREATGYGAARADLFVERPWVVVPMPGLSRLGATVEALARATGAHPVTMDAAAHDDAVASISHLPLVLSAVLVEAVAARRDWPSARTLAATGWESMTRLALGDVEMATGIAATNADALTERLRAVRAQLDAWIKDLDAEAPDADALRLRFAAAREHLERPE